MRPDVEYAARQLAVLVLEQDRRESPGLPVDTGHVAVSMELRGMVRTIRRELLLDHAELAGRLADEIERQAAEVDLDALIAATVKREIEAVKSGLARKVSEILNRTVESRIADQVDAVAKVVAHTATEKLLDAVRR